MTARVRTVVDGRLSFQCPGCGDNHTVKIDAGGWTYNGDVERPTLSPSVLVRSGHYASSHVPGDPCWCGTEHGFNCYFCHSFVTDGRIQFLSDCSHALAGKTVDLPEVT